MQRSARALPVRGRALSSDRFYRMENSVTVKVLEGSRELDSFRASDAGLLRDALRPIYRHLNPCDQAVEFSGTRERWLPGGFQRTRTEVGLPNLEAALEFLAA